ncbi:hypothetical protein OEZ85_007553 [Tetradesmus obliquus]|uniref:F-box domain-containing protein n=1 Tax=Tetradesmus obliquus TaxID=3088 RepID=A0ABY8TGH9_TETOB|nr:hypothetical protein OEZ85_007553 [Tetradesmus obliquus]
MDTILLLETPTFEFPKGVLCHILNFIDTQQRLTSCSRVSHAWHEAAASATTTITASQLHEQHVGPADKPECPQHQANGADRPSSLALWLHRHGSNLTQLTVIKDSSSDWGWRPWFSVRRRLEWPFLRCGLGSCLGDLVQLTHLYVSCLQQLRELEFCMCGGLQRAAGALVELPASLTSLKIICHVNLQWLEFTDARMPGIFNSLSNLQHLELYDALSLNPHVLTRLPALTCLRIEQYDIKGFFEFDPPGEAGEMALMTVLPQLSQLQQLQLSCVLYGGVQEPLQLLNYSALFSASCLTTVNLMECEFDPGFGRAVFAPDVLQLPQLLRLQMGWGFGDDVDRLTNSATNHFYDKEEWPLGPGDIESEALSVYAWQHLEEVLPCGAVLGQCRALFEWQGDEQHEQHAAG